MPYEWPVRCPGREPGRKGSVGCRKSLQLLSLSQVSCRLLVSLILKLRQFATVSEKLTFSRAD